jgi:hypothetical protein
MPDSHGIPPEDLNFHYNREARLKQLSSETYRQLYEPRKKVMVNKRLLIVLIDILLIVVALITVTAYRSNMGRARGISGCDLELTGFVYDGTGFLSLKITVTNPDKAPDLVRVRFTLDQWSEEIPEVVPGIRDGVRIIRAQAPVPPDSERRVSVEVFLGEEIKKLEKTITGE